MSASAPPTPSRPLDRLEEPETIDDVLRNVDQIIDWSIKAESHIGYFAVLYKRTTLAIRAGIDEGVFDDGQRHVPDAQVQLPAGEGTAQGANEAAPEAEVSADAPEPEPKRSTNPRDLRMARWRPHPARQYRRRSCPRE